ncbi:MAG: hypothetical protein WCS73_11005, partial [Lentisphaeria bacterium]
VELILNSAFIIQHLSFAEAKPKAFSVVKKTLIFYHIPQISVVLGTYVYKNQRPCKNGRKIFCPYNNSNIPLF